VSDPPAADSTSAARRVKDTAIVNGYRLGSLAARLMPGPLASLTASSLGFTASFANAERRAMVERHQRRVRPHLGSSEVRLAVQQAFDSYARYYMESFRLPSMSAKTVARTFRIDGWERVLQALEAGNGAILALPHLGGWEWAGRWMSDQGLEFTVVVEALEPPELFEWFSKLRADLGMTVVPTGPEAGAAVLRALRANQPVCLLSDRDIDRTGVEVEFFGERTTLPGGPATLALRTGAALLPVGCYFTSGYNGHHTIVREPVPTERLGRLREDVGRVTQLLATELELLIRRAPEQWHLFQPNWPSDPGY
jgi:phosphatidylinositol dimannoside acyltransferase